MADQTQNPELFELNNGTMQVLISNLGCTITSLSVPDKDGNEHFCCFFRISPSSCNVVDCGLYATL